MLTFCPLGQFYYKFLGHVFFKNFDGFSFENITVFSGAKNLGTPFSFSSDEQHPTPDPSFEIIAMAIFSRKKSLVLV